MVFKIHEVVLLDVHLLNMALLSFLSSLQSSIRVVDVRASFRDRYVNIAQSSQERK